MAGSKKRGLKLAAFASVALLSVRGLTAESQANGVAAQAAQAGKTELAGSAKSSSAEAGSKGKGKGPARELSFDDLLVQGKYHFSEEAVTTVEEDKVLDALLGTRTDFKDRIKKSASRQ